MTRKELNKLYRYFELMIDGIIGVRETEDNVGIEFDDNAKSIVVKIDNINPRDYDWLRQ